MNLKIIFTVLLFLFISGCSKFYNDTERLNNGTIVVGSKSGFMSHSERTMWFCPKPSGQCVEMEVEEK